MRDPDQNTPALIGPETERAKSYDVFVSYKRADAAAREVLIDALKAEGFDPWWDAKLGAGNWRHQLRDEINRCDVVIALWSRRAHAAPDEVKMEMAHAFGVKKLLPVALDDAPIPKQFAGENFLRFDGWETPERAAEQLKRILAEARRMGAQPSEAPTAVAAEPAIPVDLGGLPGAPSRLIGRDVEMDMLRKAWANPAVNAVVLHALGGAGKSALLRTFVNERLANGDDGAARIYGWSAYSQGSGDQKRADADGFITRALSDFGYAGEPIRDPVARARELAQRIQRQRVLLLLDGLEPLQDPPGVNKGRFKDKGLATLIRTLANANPGLVVLTSRQEVPELEGAGDLVVHWPLEKLAPSAGADLLVDLGAKGRQRDLEAAVEELEGHALSVTLLGTFVAEVCRGDIQQRDRFKFGEIILNPEEQESADDTLIPAKRAEKVMAGYLEQFENLAKTAGQGAPERALLNLIGLFDRPVDGPAVDMLLSERIEGLTDDLFVEPVEKKWLFGAFSSIAFRDLSAHERAARLREAKSRLRKLRLIAKEDPNDSPGLDAHPVVRVYFAERLDQTAPEAAKGAHSKLFDFYRALPEQDLPDTVEAMQPLFDAIGHGVKAGRAQEAYDDVFRRRVRRNNEQYLNRVHGAVAAELAVIARFFETPWTRPNQSLVAGDKAWLLSSAAYCLTALGRLDEALAPREAGLAADIESEDWRNAAVAGGNLSDALLTLGRVQDAVAAAELAIAHADRSGDADQRQYRRTDLAAALVAAGGADRAEALFVEAEDLQRESRPGTPDLVSLQGYQYGDLLLAKGAVAEALTRGRTQLDIAERFLGRGMGLQDIGFARLLIGRALDAQDAAEAAAMLDAAVEGMRRSGSERRVPETLLARAAHRRKRAAAGETDLHPALREDLAEIEDIAAPEMRLYLADLALERARLALDVPAAFDGPHAARAEAETQTARAAELIAAIGYHRRDGELAELQARLAAA